MSRGPGRMQKKILAYLDSNGQTTIESLRWKLKPDDEEDLSVATINSVNRSIESLAANGEVKREQRPLQSFEECVTHFPGKTLRLSVRQLRIELLPALLKPVDGMPPVPRYGLAQNEKYQLRRMSQNEKESLKRNWLQIEPELASFLGSAKALDDRNAVLHLYSKAKSIFETPRIEVSRALKECVAGCGSLLPPDLAAKIERLDATFLPEGDAGNLRMRSFIHSFVHVYSKGTCRLKKETIQHLLRVRPDYLRGLPGYKGGLRTGEARGAYSLIREEEQQDGIVHKLIDQTVFQEFNFIEAA